MQETHTQAATCRGVERRQPLLNMTSKAAQDSPVATQFQRLQRLLLCDIGTDLLNVADLQHIVLSAMMPHLV